MAAVVDTGFSDLPFQSTLAVEYGSFVFSLSFVGLATWQWWNYTVHTSRLDISIMRALVGFIWFLDMYLVILALVTLVFDFNNRAKGIFDTPFVHWSRAPVATLATSSFYHFLFRFIFIYRIFKYNKRIYSAAALMMLNCIVLVASLSPQASYRILVIAIENLHLNRWMINQDIIIFLLRIVIFVDILMAGVLGYLAFKLQNLSRTNLDGCLNTKAHTDLVMRQTIPNGVMTWLVITSCILAYLTTSFAVVLSFVCGSLPQVYCVFFVSIVNSKEDWDLVGLIKHGPVPGESPVEGKDEVVETIYL